MLEIDIIFCRKVPVLWRKYRRNMKARKYVIFTAAVKFNNCHFFFDFEQGNTLGNTERPVYKDFFFKYCCNVNSFWKLSWYQYQKYLSIFSNMYGCCLWDATRLKLKHSLYPITSVNPFRFCLHLFVPVPPKLITFR